MTFKRGTLWNKFPEIPSSSTQFTYYLAMEGMNRDVQFDEKFMKCSSEKRGLMLKPFLMGDEYNIQELASKHYEKLTELNPHFQNDIPILINIFDNLAGSTRLDLDNIREYCDYLTSRIHFETKPIVRVAGGQWDNWMKEVGSKNAAMLLLTDCDLLLSNPGGFPRKLDQYGLPFWWEYDYGRYAYDSTRVWSRFIIDDEPVVVIPPVIIPDPEEPEVIDDDGFDDYNSPPKLYEIRLLGGLIKGTITEIK